MIRRNAIGWIRARACAATLVALATFLVAPSRAVRAQDASDLRGPLTRILAQPEEIRSHEAPMFEAMLAELREDPNAPLLELVLMRLHALARARSMRETLLAEVDTALESATLEPFHRSLLAAERLQLERILGEVDPDDEARFLRRIPPRWWVAGPFGIRGADCLDWRFPPEAIAASDSVDLAGAGATAEDAVETPGGERSWKEIERPARFASVPLSRVVDTRFGAAYAVTQVRSPTTRSAMVEIGCASSIRVWWNGSEILYQDRDRGDEAILNRIEVTLREGWNRILVKVTGNGSERFYLRIYGPKGAELDDLEPASTPTLEPVPPAAPGEPAARPFRDDLVILEEARGGASDPFVLAARAWLRLARGEVTESADLFRRAAEVAPDSPHFAIYAGAGWARARHLPETQARHLARQAYQHALDLDPSCVPALTWFAYDRQQEGDTTEAFHLLERAAAAAPWNVDVDLMLAELCSVSDWTKEREEILERARAKAPDDPKVLMEIADFHMDEGRVERAIEFLEASLAADHDQPERRVDLALLYQRLGRSERAKAILAEELADQPASPGARLRLAELLASEEDVDGARALLEEGTELFPTNGRLLRELGDLHTAHGRPEEAVRWYAKLLAMRPAEHEVRDELARMEGVAAEPLFDEFRVDSAPLLALDEDWASRYPRAASVALLDDLILRFYSDGSGRMVTHQIFRILSEEGVEEHGTVAPGGTILEMRTVRPDGQVLEPITLSGDRYTLPGLEIGACAEWRTETRIPNLAGLPLRMPTFYFQDPDSKSPFVRSRYVIIQPRDLALRHVVRNFPWRPVILERGDDIVTIYDVHDLPLLEPEPYMPDPTENVPQVTLVEAESWKELNQTFRLESKVTVTPEVRRKAAEWVDGVAGESAQAHALYERIDDWVRDPRGSSDATETLVLRAGNRLVLFMAMLEAAGIDYRYGRARRSPELDLEDPRWDWLREDLFPNPLVRVQPDDGPSVWVVPGPPGQPYGTIPSSFYGSPAFLVDDDEGTIDYLPAAPMEDEIRIVSDVDLTPVGLGFEAQIRLRLPPSMAGFLRDQLRNASSVQKRGLGANLAQGYLPGTRLEEVRFLGLEEEVKEGPIFVEAKVTAESVQMQSGQNLMALRLGFPLLNLVGRFSTPGERTHPFLLDGYDYRLDRLRIHLGENYRAASLPADLETDPMLGPYRLDVRPIDGGMEVVREVSFHPVRIPPERYPAFLEACRRIDDREAERIWILPLAEAMKQAEEGSGDGSAGSGSR